jgi:hypothetical protein
MKRISNHGLALAAMLGAAVAILLACEGSQGEANQSTGDGGTVAGDGAVDSVDGPGPDLGDGLVALDGASIEAVWIDPHVHLRSEKDVERYVSLADQAGISEMVLQSLPRSRAFIDGTVATFNAESLLARVRHPTRFRVYGGLDFVAIKGMTAEAAATELERQTEEMAEVGFDGLKIYMNQSTVGYVKQATGLDWLPDSPLAQGVFKVANERKMPALIHLDAPYHKSGMTVVSKYPNIIWLVTHFGTVANDLAAVEKIANAGANVYLEIGHFAHLLPILLDPGGRNFLIKYADRILAGTDIGSGCEDAKVPGEPCPTDEQFRDMATVLRNMLETDKTFTYFDVYSQQNRTVQGARLDAAVLRKLYYDNFFKLFGPNTRGLDCAKAAGHIDALLSHASDQADIARVTAIRDEIAQSVCP